jgi:A/G-specific adenine glycosylase
MNSPPSKLSLELGQAFSKAHAIFDGNVKRVLARFFGIEGAINAKETIKILADLADACMPEHSCQAYTQAIMDMGATCCKPKNPSCPSCPLNTQCQAFLLDKANIIPGKAKKKAIQEVHYQFWLYINSEQEIFLVKRPTKGIWPNLWCFPEVRTPCAIPPVLEFQHRLTHQLMHISLQLSPVAPQEDIKGIWVNTDNYQSLGLPKAISGVLPKIFLGLRSPSHA